MLCEWIAYYCHSELLTATTGMQKTITCSTYGWLMFSSSTSTSWKNTQSCKRHITPVSSRRERASKTHGFSSTEWESTLRNAKTSKSVEMLVYFCMLMCVFSSVTVLHWDYCVMWITWFCWILRFRGPLGSERQTDRHGLRGFTVILWSLQSNMERKRFTRQCCPLVSTLSTLTFYMSDSETGEKLAS